MSRTTILAGLALLAACGGDSATGPSETTKKVAMPIPEQLYQVQLTNARNTCGAADVGGFTLLILPQGRGGSYQVLGLTDDAVPATVAGDRMTLTTAIPVDSGVVTLRADWTFAADRHTFSGTTTFVVALRGYPQCTFTFAAAGTHAEQPAMPAPSGSASLSATGASQLGAQLRVSADAAIGSSGVVGYASSPVVTCTEGKGMYLPAPQMYVRNLKGTNVLETDAVAFRYHIYRIKSTTMEGASIEMLTTLLAPSTPTFYTSDWYWKWQAENQAWGTFGASHWGMGRYKNRAYESAEAQLTFTGGSGFYYVVYEVYWYPRAGVAGAGSNRLSAGNHVRPGWENSVATWSFCKV